LGIIACMVRKYYNEKLGYHNPGRGFFGRVRGGKYRLDGPGKGIRKGNPS